MSINIAFVNSKGGVGKTSSVIHTCGILSDRGYRILVIDMDRQRNVSSVFLRNDREYVNDRCYTICDWLHGDCKLFECVRSSFLRKTKDRKEVYYNIDVVPGDRNLSDGSWLREVNIERELQEYVRSCDYDFVIVDMPPSNVGVNHVCFGQIVQYIMLPFTPDYFSIDGYKLLMDDVSEAKSERNDLHVVGIYFNRFDKRTGLHSIYVEKMEEHFGDLFMKTIIPDLTEAGEAIYCGLPVSFYKKHGKVANAFDKLVDEMLERIRKIH